MAAAAAARTPQPSSEKRKIESFDEWVGSLYDVSKVSEEDLAAMYEALKYNGFDRESVLKELQQKGFPHKILVEMIIACALRGPKRASETKLSNGRTIQEMGIRASGLKALKGVSCARITSCTADLAAFYLKKLNVPKRMAHDCPAWLQFPAAGSIKLPRELRDVHRDFSEKFSKLIKGGFSEDIYGQMTMNAYLDPRLKLFE